MRKKTSTKSIKKTAGDSSVSSLSSLSSSPMPATTISTTTLASEEQSVVMPETPAKDKMITNADDEAYDSGNDDDTDGDDDADDEGTDDQNKKIIRFQILQETNTARLGDEKIIIVLSDEKQICIKFASINGNLVFFFFLFFHYQNLLTIFYI